MSIPFACRVRAERSPRHLGFCLGCILVGVLIGGNTTPASAQEVVLPVEDFDRLWLSAHQEDEDPEPALDVAFESAEVEVDVGTGGVTARYRLVVATFTERSVRFDLPPAGGWTDADWTGVAEGASGTLVATDDGDDQVEIRGRGRHEVRLEAAQALREDDASRQGERRFTVGLPESAALHVSLVAPGATEVTSPGASWRRSGVASDRWVLHSWSGGATSLDVRLRDGSGRDDPARRDLRFEAVASTRVDLGRLRSRGTARIQAEVWQGVLTELVASVPAGWDVVGVDGRGVADWNLSEATPEGTSTLRLETGAPIHGRFEALIGLSGPGVDTDDEVAAPLVRVAGATRQQLESVVRLEGDGILSLVDPGSGHEPSASSAGGAQDGEQGGVQDGLRLAVADGAHPPSWSVRWADGTDVLALQVDRLLVNVMVGLPETPGGVTRAFYRLWTEVRSSGAGRLELDLPGARVVKVQRDGVLFRTGRGAGGWQVPLTVDTKPQVVQLDLVAVVRWPDGDGILELPLPRLNAPAAKVEVKIALPAEARAYRLAEAARRGSASAPPGLAGSGTGTIGAAGQLALGQQALSNQAVRVRAIQADPFLEPPIGFVQLTASWSALSATPGPLRIEVEADRPDRDWM